MKNKKALIFLFVIALGTIIFYLSLRVSRVESKELRRIELKQLSNRWGQFTSNTESYRGKAGLVHLAIESSGEFKAFISGCTGRTGQAGKWDLKGSKITFLISNHTGKPFSKVLARNKISKITYNIVSLADDLLILKNENKKETLKFKPTKH